MTDLAAAPAGASSTDAFNYLSVLLSIILGLAITQILKGFRGLVLSRARVVSYWPSLVLSGLLLLIAVQSWWAMFEMRSIPAWTFPMFAAVLLQTTLLYMLAALVLPDFFGDGTVDLRLHYFAHRQLFFALFVAVLTVSIGKEWVLYRKVPDPIDLTFQLSFMAFAVAGTLTSREWFHKLFCLIGVLTFVAYITVLFAHLR